MVQVIQLHPYKDGYPFGLQKDTQCTYVQLIRQLRSQNQIVTYKQNLMLFKSINSQLIIKLDSYVKQSNQLQLYYEYQPISLKMYIEDKLSLVSDDTMRDKFLNKMVNNLNQAIEAVISILSEKKILAVLSIEHMAASISKAQGDKVKFFIDPDFQVISEMDNKNKPRNFANQINEYYQTQKKKLQIQLQQFLQTVFNIKKPFNKQTKKANFIIQGTKLVFVGEDESTRQSSMSGITNILTNMNIKIPQNLQNHLQSQHSQAQSQNQGQKNIVSDNTGTNINANKTKFDIKNILDEKKLQKNQVLTDIVSSTSKQGKQQQKRPQHKKSFTGSNNTSKNGQQNQTGHSKQVRNYFENNDDFNKDASFYPQQFIKQQSIAELDGYQDELQKQLEDLKRKILEEDEGDKNSIGTGDSKNQKNQKNRLSIAPPAQQQMVNQSNQNALLQDAKMTKQVPYKMENSNNYMNFQGKSNNSSKNQTNHYTSSNNSNNNIYTNSTKNSHLDNNSQYGTKPNSSNNLNPSKDNNLSNNSHEQQNSVECKQKKKYKVKITTSHQVDVQGEDADMKQIQKQIIDDIKKGKLKQHNRSGDEHHQQFFKNLGGNENTHTLQSSHINTTNPSNMGSCSMSKQQQKQHIAAISKKQPLHSNQLGHNPNKMNSQNNTSLFLNRQDNIYNSNHLNQDNAFSKNHPHISSQTGGYLAQEQDRRQSNVNFNNNYPSNSSSNNPTNSSNSYVNLNKNISHAVSTPQSSNTNFGTNDIKKMIQKIKINSNLGANKQTGSVSVYSKQQQEHRPSSNLSSSSNSHQGNSGIQMMPSNQGGNIHDPTYHDKIQKAKMKAEEIMKLVKQRKVQ